MGSRARIPSSAAMRLSAEKTPALRSPAKRASCCSLERSTWEGGGRRSARGGTRRRQKGASCISQERKVRRQSSPSWKQSGRPRLRWVRDNGSDQLRPDTQRPGFRRGWPHGNPLRNSSSVGCCAQRRRRRICEEGGGARQSAPTLRMRSTWTMHCEAEHNGAVSIRSGGD